MTTRSALVRWPRSWPPRRAANGGNARDERDEPSRKTGATHAVALTRPRWQSRATALAFLLMALSWPRDSTGHRRWPRRCEIPAAAASSRDHFPATPGAPTPTSDTRAPPSSRSRARTNQQRQPRSPHPRPRRSSQRPTRLQLLTEELTAVAESLAACLSEGDAETVTELAAERYLGQLFGSSVPFSRDDYVAIASELTPIPTRIMSRRGCHPIGR